MKLKSLMNVLRDAGYVLMDKSGVGIGKGEVSYEGEVTGCANLYLDKKVRKVTTAIDCDVIWISVEV